MQKILKKMWSEKPYTYGESELDRECWEILKFLQENAENF
jgi:hypothetical protein